MKIPKYQRYIIVMLLFSSGILSSASDLSDLKKQMQTLIQDVQSKNQQIELLKQQIDQLENKGHQVKAKPDLNVTTSQTFTTSAQLNYYWDKRDFNTFSIITSAKGIPGGFSFWGFTDLHGDQKTARESVDHTRYFMEYRLSRPINPKWVLGIKGLGIQAEFNDLRGSNNNLIRAGFTFKHKIPSFTNKKGWLQWRGFPVESDGDGGQASLIYNIPLHERIWISGFADVNFIGNASDRWVIEPQLNIKLNDHVKFLVEYRYSGFERVNPATDSNGVAIGLGVSF